MNSNVSQPESSRRVSIKNIFLAARELTAGEQRDRFLAEAVGDDQELRCRVERMLASEDSSNPKPLAQAVDNLDLAAYDVTTVPVIDVSEHPSIGPYKLLDRLGEGGMGEVFVAEQSQPVRRIVALKLIKRGMDSKEVIARFEAERQALALMNHPNIASVLDAGQTDDGRPYFVMDLVRGIRITDYCAQQKLSLRERLELMVTVCQAVQHAHQKGIIHRDLKPGNILIELHDVRHVPKIIDFGVAKATNQRLTEHTLFTQLSQMIGTPLYMSPEQAELSGLDVDTRSDVYSLGVLLYELLTGSTPFDKKTLNTVGFDEMRRIIREDEPPKPSDRLSTIAAAVHSTISDKRGHDRRRLGQSLKGELDWIVMRALEKDRTRRYESASAFAADIERHLRDEPVEACPPSSAYRLKKFARRNRGVLTSCVVVVTALMVGSGLSFWKYLDEQEARQEADAQRNLAQQSEDFSLQLVYSADVTLAAQAWKSEDMRRFTDLLDRHLPIAGKTDRRGFEWWYLRQFGAARFRNIATETGGTSVVRYSPNGKYLVTGRTDGTLCIRDGRSHERLAILQAHEGLLRGIDFAPDGVRMASIGDDGMICLWDLADQKRLHRFHAHPDHGFRVFFLMDGKMLASCGEGTSVRLWDASTGEAIGELEGYVESAAMDRSPDGRLCASGDQDRSVCVWDVQTHKKLCKLELPPNHRAWCVCFSPDGRFVAVGTNQNDIRLCDARTGNIIDTLAGHHHDIQAVTFHPSGRLLASSDFAGVIRLWPLGSDRDVGADDFNMADQWSPCFQGHSARVWSLDFSPDGTRLVSASNDGTVRSWTGRTQPGRDIAETSDANSVTFVSRGSELLIAADNSVRVWNRKTDKIRRFDKIFSEAASCVAVSPDGKTCATGHNAGIIRFWCLQTGQLRKTLTGHEIGVDQIEFSPDGRLLATASWDGTAKLWDTVSGRQHAVFDMHQPHCYDVAFSPNGRLLACSSEDNAMLFDVASQKRLHLLQGHQNSANAVAFSPDGQLLATGSSDHTIRLWDVDTGEVKHVIAAQKEEIYSLAFSPDGRTLASGGKYGMIAFSHVATGRFLFDTKVGNKSVNWLEFSPDGEILAATVKQKGVQLLFGPQYLDDVPKEPTHQTTTPTDSGLADL